MVPIYVRKSWGVPNGGAGRREGKREEGTLREGVGEDRNPGLAREPE